MTERVVLYFVIRFVASSAGGVELFSCSGASCCGVGLSSSRVVRRRGAGEAPQSAEPPSVRTGPAEGRRPLCKGMPGVLSKRVCVCSVNTKLNDESSSSTVVAALVRMTQSVRR